MNVAFALSGWACASLRAPDRAYDAWSSIHERGGPLIYLES
jgi:hypothetical protein